MKRFVPAYLTGSIAVFMLAAPIAHADDASIPVQQLMTAVQTAVSAYPGNIQEVDVEDKKGRKVVEVTIRGTDGKDKELSVDVEKNEVIK